MYSVCDFGAESTSEMMVRLKVFYCFNGSLLRRCKGHVGVEIVNGEAEEVMM